MNLFFVSDFFPHGIDRCIDYNVFYTSIVLMYEIQVSWQLCELCLSFSGYQQGQSSPFGAWRCPWRPGCNWWACWCCYGLWRRLSAISSPSTRQRAGRQGARRPGKGERWVIVLSVTISRKSTLSSWEACYTEHRQMYSDCLPDYCIRMMMIQC